MKEAALHDPRRLAALRRLQLLDTPPEETLDRLTRLAAKIIRAPIALVSLVDDKRQFFKSSFGMPEEFLKCRETPLEHSFCKHVVLGRQPLIVKDARKHPLLKGNPAVPHLLVAYAGIPLRASSGEAIGSFCVIDTVAREWSVDELMVLQDLADTAMAEFQLRDLALQLAAEHRMREELVDAVTRDLSAPLRRMLSSLQATNSAGALPPVPTTLARNEAERLAIKLNDLVDVARLERGTLLGKPQRVDLVRLIEIAVLKSEPIARDLRISIEVKLPNLLPRVIADPRILQRVLLILMRHAIRFTEKGSVVYFEAVQQDSLWVRCSISDSGFGLSDQVRQELFDGYLLDGPDRSPRLAQSGLGMTFCRQAIEMSGGKVGIFSQEGLGSTVWFTLPAA